MAKLTRKERQFYMAEGKLLDKLYKVRVAKWQKLIDMYNNEFNERIRDLAPEEMVRIPRFFPLVRQIVGTIAFNYPTLAFTVEDDEGAGAGISDILERASSSFLRLTNSRDHIHQAIFDALVAGIGWVRLDYNPPGDDMIAPYVTNDALAEDMVSVSRVPPGHVHLDPTTPPHMLGAARYIRELMWVPLEQLKADDQIKNKNQIKATAPQDGMELGFGDSENTESGQPEEEALKASVDNGDFVLVERWHDRINKKLIMFAKGVDEEIYSERHPFANMVFPQQTNILGQPILDEDEQPVFDLEAGEEAPGWLVENGFAFVPIKFDLNANNYYPTSQLEYLKDIQLGIVESMSRQSGILKRTARQGIVQESEDDKTVEDVSRPDDGQWTKVKDIGNWQTMDYGGVPAEQFAFEDRLRGYEQEVTQVNDFTAGAGEEAKTATEAGLMAAVADVNREWMEAGVGRFYEDVQRNAFQIMGDPRYQPENFEINVAPDGQERLSRALRNADFLWNYRIVVQAGSTRPLFEQFQKRQFVDFYDRAINSPNFDRMELDKLLASAYEIVDPEKIIRDDVNEDAQRAAALENDWMVTKGEDPGVEQGQDHREHIEVHGQYQNHPKYQELVQAAQAVNINQIPINPQAAQGLQFIDQVVQQHMQIHEQTLQEEQSTVGSPGGGAGTNPVDSLQSQVASNAQNISNQVRGDTADAQG
tara:strand:+ start:326 stop:2437 length:2112 start_codon:yes stop_codon:yes gene_type:complete